MKAMSVRIYLALTVALLAAGTARAELISGSGIVSSFDGSFHYAAATPSSATLTISLTNTTAPIFGGHLTGFAFNNPGNSITGVSFSSTDAEFNLLGGPTFNNTVPAFPFGRFDIGTSTGGTVFGDAGQGLSPGESATFSFLLAGSNLDQLTTASFFATPSAKTFLHPWQTEFVATFRYVRILPDLAIGTALPDPEPMPQTVPAGVPEPGALTLAGLGVSLCGLSMWRRYRRARLADRV